MDEGMLFEDRLKARGHVNVRGTHPTTVMITTDAHLSLKGDCILAVSADKGLRDLPEELKEAARSSEAKIRLILSAAGESVEVNGWGDPHLTFEDPSDMVVRRSRYTCGRTLMVHADKAAVDLPVSFRSLLRNPTAEVTIKISVETPEAPVDPAFTAARVVVKRL